MAEQRGGPRKQGRPRPDPRTRRGERAPHQRGVHGRERRDTVNRSAEQARYDGPPIPEDITGKELDTSVLAQLRSLPEKLGTRVARHIAAAGRLLEEDPETAYQHMLAARARAARLAVVREATGEAAYAAGHFAEALTELKAVRRMTGSAEHLPVMADCERALGRPERALALAASPAAGQLSQAARVELTIVEAGARSDLGEIEGALRILERGPLRSPARDEWVARLRYAYADLLARAGRQDEALEWFHRAEAVDGAGLTDAAARALELEGVADVSPDD